MKLTFVYHAYVSLQSALLLLQVRMTYGIFFVEKMVPELLQWQLERKSCIAVKSVTKASSSHPIAPKHVVGVDAVSFLRDCITCLKTVTPCSEVIKICALHYKLHLLVKKEKFN